MEMSKETYASLSEPARFYLEHIGIITCKQDYLNKRTVLGKIARCEEFGLAIKVLNNLPGIKKEFIKITEERAA